MDGVRYFGAELYGVLIMWRTNLRATAFGMGGAIVGGLLLYAALHLWNDHWALHQLAQYISTVAPKVNALK